MQILVERIVTCLIAVLVVHRDVVTVEIVVADFANGTFFRCEHGEVVGDEVNTGVHLELCESFVPDQNGVTVLLRNSAVHGTLEGESFLVGCGVLVGVVGVGVGVLSRIVGRRIDYRGAGVRRTEISRGCKRNDRCHRRYAEHDEKIKSVFLHKCADFFCGSCHFAHSITSICHDY